MNSQQSLAQIADYAKAKGFTRAEWRRKLALLYIAIERTLSEEKRTPTGSHR